MSHPRKLLSILEHRLEAYASYNNVRHVLSTYGVSVPDEKLERVLVVLVTEMKKEIHAWAEKLPEDEVEAEAKIQRQKGPRKNGTKKAAKSKKPSWDLSEYEVIELD